MTHTQAKTRLKAEMYVSEITELDTFQRALAAKEAFEKAQRELLKQLSPRDYEVAKNMLNRAK
jgi:phosphopantetheinyl transferase (holo-ACP synthase)